MTLRASELQVGDTYSEEVCRNLSRTQIVQYAGASGDYNPLHSDEIFTTQIAGYPSVFAHGMLSNTTMNGCVQGLRWKHGSYQSSARPELVQRPSLVHSWG